MMFYTAIVIGLFAILSVFSLNKGLINHDLAPPSYLYPLVSLLGMILFFGLLAALLMNDTVAIIGTPILLSLAKRHQFEVKPLLLGLAYAITIGSVFSPIGNPQNLLIANSSVPSPFITFIRQLFIPTLIILRAGTN